MDVMRGENEPFEALLRRFTKKVEGSGVLNEARRRAFYEKPSETRSREAARRRKTAVKGNHEAR